LRGFGGAEAPPFSDPGKKCGLRVLQAAVGAVVISALMVFASQSLAARQDAPRRATGTTTEFNRLAHQASQARQANDLERATTLYQQALKLNPRWKEGWWYLGSLYYDGNQYPRGVAAFKTLVELDPHLGTGWTMLGLCEFETRDYSNSFIHLEKGFQEGLADNDDLVRVANYHLGLLYIMHGNFEMAFGTLRALAFQGPVSNPLRFALGMALLRIPLLPSQVDPTQDALIDKAGEAGELIALQDYDQAEAVLKQLVEEYPTAHFVHYAYGSMLAQMVQYGEAIKQLRRETEITPDSPLPYLHLAFVELRMSQEKDALPFAQKAVQLSPHSFVSHYLLGRSLLGVGRVHEAIEQLEIARNLGPQAAEVRYSLAVALARDNQPEAAARERAEFTRLNALAQKLKSQSGGEGDSYRMSDSRGTLEPSQVGKPSGSAPQ